MCQGGGVGKGTGQEATDEYRTCRDSVHNPLRLKGREGKTGSGNGPLPSHSLNGAVRSACAWLVAERNP